GTSAAKALVTHLATAAVSASLWSAVAMGIARGLDRGGLFPGVEERIRGQLGLLIAAGALLYLLAVAAHYLVVAFEASREADRRALRAEIEAREAELRALRAQVDPHFLFNSLNSISSLITADAGGARAMCVQLGDFLRASLGLGMRATVTLAEELETLELYLLLERTRFGSRLEVNLEFDESSRACLVPPLVLQPLVENALKHGISTMLEGGTIHIAAHCRSGRLRLIVENPFDPKALGRRGSGMGLTNLRQRLHSLYGTAARLRADAEGDTFWVEVVLPIDTEEHSE
ncbi:MAG: histidine kinase, partial [Acidobacteria bacterium]|nr:histidine kinase [Acidobacteriota bacterium]